MKTLTAARYFPSSVFVTFEIKKIITKQLANEVVNKQIKLSDEIIPRFSTSFIGFVLN